MVPAELARARSRRRSKCGSGYGSGDETGSMQSQEIGKGTRSQWISGRRSEETHHYDRSYSYHDDVYDHGDLVSAPKRARSSPRTVGSVRSRTRRSTPVMSRVNGVRGSGEVSACSSNLGCSELRPSALSKERSRHKSLAVEESMGPQIRYQSIRGPQMLRRCPY
jgi:hypothetical protein